MKIAKLFSNRFSCRWIGLGAASLLAIALAGCGSGGGGGAAPAAPVGGGTAGKLTLSLAPSLDSGGDIKATSLTAAVLLNPAGTVLVSATITGGNAEFSLANVAPGDYFIKVNGLGDDLVPTRIDDQSATLTQQVGQKLRATTIGSASDPTYRVKTYSKGQGEHPVVKYADGTNLGPDEYPYAVVSLKTTPLKIETRVLGTAALITSYSPSGTAHPFATWILGSNNHGKPANYTSDSACNTCHGSLNSHPGQFSSVTTSAGWCYRCHFGKGGDPDGMIDPSFSLASTGKLTLALDASLDGGGTMKATSITSADMLDSGNKVITSATITGGNAEFDLANVAPGDYFIKVNGLGDDLVATRIVDQTATLTQFVGQKLRFAVIGSKSDPTFKLKTYSLGQGEAVIKKWSTGTDVSPAVYGYALQSLKTTPKFLETRVLGTAALLVRKDASSTTHSHGQGDGAFGDWLLGANNHGRPLNYVSDSSCTGCHGTNLDTKPATYSAVTTTSGWCFKCHLGKGGDGAGLIDPLQ